MKNNKKFLFAISSLVLASNLTPHITPVNANVVNNAPSTLIERRNSSDSGSSDSSSGIYGADTSTYDASKIQNLGQKMEQFVKPGDIYIDTIGAIIKVGWIKYETGHAGVVKEVYYKDDGTPVIKSIEALGADQGIQEVELTASRVYNGYIYRVPNLTDEQISKVIEFNEKQIGKEYNFHLTRRNTSINSDKWYCSELVVASFKYGANVNLASNDSWLWIEPVNIGKNENTKKVIDNNVNISTTAVDNGSQHTIVCDSDSWQEGHDYSLFGSYCRACGHSH